MSAELPPVTLGPLSNQQRRDVSAVKEAIESFWDNIKFRKGWEKPLFSKQSVEKHLQEAAEIIVRIRSELDRHNDGVKLRMLEGAAKEFLWQFVRNPQQHSHSFVRGLVHAALSDANGYVEGLERSYVDAQIERIRAWWREQHGANDEAPSFEMLPSRLGQLSALASSLYSGDADLDDPTIHHHIHEALSHLQGIEANLRAVQDRQRELAEKRQDEERRLEQEEAERRERERIEQQRAEEKRKQGEHEARKRAEAEAQEAERERLQALHQQQREKEEQERKQAEEATRRNQAEEERRLQDAMEVDEASDSAEDPRPSLKKSGAFNVAIGKIEGDVNALGAQLTTLEDQVALARSPGELKTLNQKVLRLTEDLMQELLALDKVQVSPSERPLRKTQVQHVERLLAEADTLRHAITQRMDAAERQKVEPVNQTPHQEPAANGEEMSQEEEEDEDQEAESVKEREEKRPMSPTIWQRMKFEPEYTSRELADAYVIQALVPGMETKDVKISLADRNRLLIISGYREPSPEETAVLRKKSSALRRQDPRGVHIPLDMDEVELMLRLGAGKFGRFETKYRLPLDVDPAAISAKYEGGQLTVILPRRAPQTYLPHSRSQGRLASGYPQSFFRDTDYFW